MAFQNTQVSANRPVPVVEARIYVAETFPALTQLNCLVIFVPFSPLLDTPVTIGASTSMFICG